MKVCKFIVSTEIRRSGGNRCSAYMEGQCVFELGESCAIIIPNQGCIGLGVPYELHINENGTLIFFTELQSGYAEDPKFRDAMYNAWALSTGAAIAPGRTRQDRDTAKTGMDAATRMLTGVGKSARQMSRSDRRTERPSPNRDNLYRAIKDIGALPDDDDDF